jgi:hypothetical protein
VITTVGIEEVAALAASPAFDTGHDHVHASLDEIGGKRRQAIVLKFGPAIFDADVLALDVSGFAESLP